MKNPEDNRVPPNIRVMYLLEVMARIGRPVTPTELNNHVGWPKQTIHRLCQTMLQAGILERHDRRLYPGRRALSAFLILRQWSAQPEGEGPQLLLAQALISKKNILLSIVREY